MKYRCIDTMTQYNTTQRSATQHNTMSTVQYNIRDGIELIEYRGAAQNKELLRDISIK